MMNFKLIGGSLLAIGTCIGAGTLALPVACATNDLFSSSLLMIICWAVMTLGAYYLLETNLKFPVGTHLISMARKTLGTPGVFCTWILMLMLLYALLSAYVTGGAQIVEYWLSRFHASFTLSALLFTLVVGSLVLKGVKQVDYGNRLLMMIKGCSLILLMLALLAHFHLSAFTFGKAQGILSATTVVMTAFGYAPIIPSLRILFQEDTASLKKVVLLGSLIPLLIYLAWNLLTHSSLPSDGPLSLTAMQQTGNASSQLAHALTEATHSKTVAILAHLFTSVCVFTSFLGVGLSLFDFWIDAIGTSERSHFTRYGIWLLTFTLPCLVAIRYPRAFIAALSYAGILCILLLILIPALMAYRARKKFAALGAPIVPGGFPLLGITILLGLFGLYLSI